jgi:DNA replication protein DnaC
MLVTSNRAVGEWGTVFGNPVVTTAILDRLLHHSHVLTISASRRASPQASAKAPSGASDNACMISAMGVSSC